MSKGTKKTAEKATKAKKPVRPLTPHKAKEKEKPLTDREEVFCLEYVCDHVGNATKAYQRAFKHVTYGTARTESIKLLAKPDIQNRIEQLKEERAERFTLTQDKITAELMKLAFYEPRDFFDDDGKLKPISELPPDHAAVIGGIETFHKVTGDDNEVCITTKIKLPDKGVNLERLGKTLAMFTDKQQISGPDGGPIEMSGLDAANRLAYLIRLAKQRKAEQDQDNGGA